MSLAVFDFDGTLVDGDAGVHFARYMTGKRYLAALTDGPLQALPELTRLNWRTATLLARSATMLVRYELGKLDRHGVVERAYRGFEGLPSDVISEAMDRFAREHLPDKLRDGIVDQMEHHIDQGDHVVVVSTGIHDLIWPLRDVLGLDFEVVACQLRERDGRLTGTVEGPLNGPQKSTRVMAIAKRRQHDLDDAWAYSDHENDAVILRMVGNPVAVHPTRRMRRIARQEHWPIVYDD